MQVGIIHERKSEKIILIQVVKLEENKKNKETTKKLNENVLHKVF